MTLIYLFTAILGLLIGSFLNVVVLRLHTKTISKGRSKCASCAHTLSGMDLIPVISFILLRGRCRYCKLRLFIQYPIVELVTALVFVSILYRVLIMTGGDIAQSVLYFLYFAIIFCLLIAMATYDLRHFILPWKLMKPFLIISFAGGIILAFLSNGLTLLNFLSGLIVALPFLAIWYFSHGRLIGFGDILLMIGFGFMMGTMGGFSAVIFGFWIGAIFFLLKMVFTGKIIKGNTAIPFGPFLVIGLYITFLTGITLSSLMFGMI